MSGEDRVMSAAEADRADAVAAMEGHQQVCSGVLLVPAGDCEVCRSLTGHVERTLRTTRQVDDASGQGREQPCS